MDKPMPKVTHNGTQVVKAPIPSDGPKGSGTVKKGDDLR